ncbi:PREDICTED: something about silencing protein 10-like [Priapulus caudatus]|uniref:Something about silencing protein 10-like n=1 Tax=Priapulus caudatus TaxID=37621 RepID=A0ABM1ETB5_PRICU|nr:PREDICTED: something about silencing protein 10-like [Priapulus caudatus]
MVKRKGGKAKGKKEQQSDEEFEQPDATSQQYYYDEVDEFHHNRQKLLLDAGKDLRPVPDDDLEESVLGVESDSDEDDSSGAEDEDNIQDRGVGDSDMDDTGDADVPSREAWGRKKSTYYNADNIDADEGESEEEAARLEEEEALFLQRKMAEQMDEQDFGLDLFKVQPEAVKDEGVPGDEEEKIEVDLSKLSKKEKLELLKRDSPELLGLIDDFRSKMQELKDVLQPLYDLAQSRKVPPGNGALYINAKYNLYLNYCINICFYLVLKAKRTPIHNHPVVKRLVTYRNLINQMVPADEVLKPEIDDILKRLANGEHIPVTELSSSEIPVAVAAASAKPKRDKRVQFKAQVASKKRTEALLDSSNKQDDFEAQFATGGRTWGRKRAFIAEEDNVDVTEAKQRREDGEEGEHEVGDVDEEDMKRPINYQIMKNKGLTPKRKKEQRNPRVKHKEKYRKALVRRKGQVQMARTEMQKYGGEHTGIRAGLKKGIKLKL